MLAELIHERDEMIVQLHATRIENAAVQSSEPIEALIARLGANVATSKDLAEAAWTINDLRSKLNAKEEAFRFTSGYALHLAREYHAMLATLTETQTRCTELANEARNAREVLAIGTNAVAREILQQVRDWVELQGVYQRHSPLGLLSWWLDEQFHKYEVP